MSIGANCHSLSFLFFPKDGLLFCKVCIATKQHTKKHFHFISVNNIVAKKLLPGKHINLKVLNNYRRKTQAWSMKNVVLITLISLEACCGYKNQIVIFISWLSNPEYNVIIKTIIFEICLVASIILSEWFDFFYE